MPKSLRQIFSEKDITFYQFDRFSLDNYYNEAFQDTNEHYESNKIFERDPVKDKRKIDLPSAPITLFRFFLDGSRKPYKIGDIITTDNKFMPVVVGQISAGCCYRNDNKKTRGQVQCLVNKDKM